MYENILSTIGNTPLVELKRLFPESHFRLFAKMESFNPGGSVKDRAAYTMLRQAMEEGIVRKGTTIIESSSGNMGIGLAQVCAYFELPFICVVDTRTTAQNISILQAYGARVDVIAEPDAGTGDLLQARINHVNYLRRVIPNSWWVNQYANIYNAQAHHQTMREIASAFNNDVDYIFCTVSTYGTLRGCSEYIRRHNLKTRIIGVDAIGSVIFGGKSSCRMIPGHGASRLPELFQPDLVDQHYHISDEETVIGCRRLLRREAILAGGSSGAVITAVEKAWDKIPTDATCVVILCDRGERYLDTIYSDAWVKRHFGDNATQIAGEPTVNHVPIS